MTERKGMAPALDALDRRNLESYTDEASRYDEVRFASPRRRYYVAHSNRLISDLIRLRAGTRVLDVATGTGRIALHLAREGAAVTGVDLTPAMLEAARKIAVAEGLSNLRFEVANARALPYDDSSFDAVTAIRFFHLLPPPVQREILDETYRVVRPGGRIVIELNNKFSGVFLRPLIDLIEERFRGAPRGGRLWPHQLARLGSGLPVLHRRGLWFLGQGHLAQLSPWLASALDRVAAFSPFCYLTEQLLVVLEKPATTGDGAR